MNFKSEKSMANNKPDGMNIRKTRNETDKENDEEILTKNKGKGTRIVITVITILCILAVFGIICYMWYLNNDEDFEEIQAYYDELQPDDEIMKGTSGDYLKDLLAINDETVAWLVIPGTNINTPVMACDDNEYYLTHSFEKEYSGYGVPFLDYRCNMDFSDFVSIIYGHNIKNSKVFGELNLFREQEFLDSYNMGYLVLNDTKYRINFFACLVAEKEGFLYEDIVFLNDDEKRAYVDEVLETAVTKLDDMPDDLTDCQLVVISTCTAHGLETRTALVGYLSDWE